VAWGVLAIGLMFVGLLGTFLLILTGQSIVDKQHANKLIDLNTALNDEIKEREQAEEALKKSQANLARAQRITRMGSWEWDIPQNNVYCSKEIYVLLGIPHQPSFGFTLENFLALVHPDDRDQVDSAFKDALAGKTPFDLSYRIIRPDGSNRTHHVRAEILFDQIGQPVKMIGTQHDITHRKQLEDQLRQAQRLESIGNLAGGVAHDFNNMLSIILGNTEIMMENMDETHPVMAQLNEIKKAAAHSVDLTRQLLAFARKQTIAPKVIDINETIEGMLKMLTRLIGENIDFAWIPKHGLWPVKVDPSQVDQMLANLCVNARDAISDVGKLIIETDNSVFNEAYCRHHLGYKPGEYVMIAVSDNGCGMDKKTCENIFEPFFSTKDFGKGTGLGLATVYGIVKQNNGFIHVYSERNKGTTFKIYLPRNAEKTVQPQPQEIEEAVAIGSETILLVEDEKAILRMITIMLTSLGYSVLTASSPTEAIAIAESRTEEIDMLMTDVVMPEMNGRELAEKVSRICPDLKRLFMSGYTANVIAHRGVLDEGMHFINKPFSKQELEKKLRDVFGHENARSPNGRPSDDYPKSIIKHQQKNHPEFDRI
jgi:signal transduction histidine kinase/FixJ family two-component response regulator